MARDSSCRRNTRNWGTAAAGGDYVSARVRFIPLVRYRGGLVKEFYTPEGILCRYCKQPIDKATDPYVLVRKATERHPEELAHVTCEQKRPTLPFDFDW